MSNVPLHRTLFLSVFLLFCSSLYPQRHIETAEQLRTFAQESQTNTFEGEVIYLDADIDLESRQWTPIGNAEYPFQGELDGQNHVIRNLYIFGATGVAGLIAETGSDAVVHNLALSQGHIITDGTNDVGCLVGIHRGRLHHCFNMAQILANNGSRIGSLVGTNYGQINYCYNTGIITKANSTVGGLVGLNKSTAELNWCYNTGYCLGSAMVGALFGENEAGSKIENVYFDQQVTRMHATGKGSSETTLVNADHAVEKTLMLRDKFSSSPEWDCTTGFYPQLTCFAGKDASLATTCPILLDTNDLPMERAEGVGTPKEGNKPRWTFNLGMVDGVSAVWRSDNESVIKVHAYAYYAEVFRPCGNQEVILTVTIGNDTRQVYTLVKGYDPFDAGSMGGTYVACWNEVIKFAAANTSKDGKEATGGKDDKQESPTDYKYLIVRYQVTYDAEHNRIYTPLDTFRLGQREYGVMFLQTDEPGEYAYKRFVHDARCRTEWAQSEGLLTLIVRKAFSTGELYEKPDTLYGVPNSILIDSKADASGGGEVFDYLWTCVQLKVDYVTGQADTVRKGPVYGADYAPVTTSTFTASYTEPGEYIYTRMVTEKSCTSKTQQSKNDHRVVVYEKIRPGSIIPFYRELCTPACSDTILEIEGVAGGNGRYTYRWTCNGVEIPNSDTTCLFLDSVMMENGHTYLFRRQVKDDTGLMDWQTSDGEVTIVVYDAYDAGAIRGQETQVCYQPDEIEQVALSATSERAAGGDGEFVYCWLLSRAAEDTLCLDTFRVDQPALDSTILLADYELAAPATLILQRLVQNSLCQTEWKPSDNEVIYHIGNDEQRTDVISLCIADLPYHGEYTYRDGRTQTYTLRADGDIWVMHDVNEAGCPLEVTILCRPTPVPLVELKPIISACETDTALLIQYTVKEGRPNSYDITFSAEALAAGFESLTEASLPADRTIRIPLPEGLAPTSSPSPYSFTILFYAASAGDTDCRGIPLTVPFSIDVDGFVHRKWNDVAFVDNSDKNCEPNCEEDLTFDSWQWYRNGEPIEGATGQYYYEYGGLNGYYQVEMTATDGTVYRSCNYEMRPITAIASVEFPSLAISPNPASPGEDIRIHHTEGKIFLYDMHGRQLIIDGQQLTAPSASGIYLVRLVSERGQVRSAKLIVK